MPGEQAGIACVRKAEAEQGIFAGDTDLRRDPRGAAQDLRRDALGQQEGQFRREIANERDGVVNGPQRAAAARGVRKLNTLTEDRREIQGIVSGLIWWPYHVLLAFTDDPAARRRNEMSARVGPYIQASAKLRLFWIGCSND